MSLEEDELERRLPNTHEWQPCRPAKSRHGSSTRPSNAKREILTLPMPDPNDDSIEAHRLRLLILAAADSTIEQTIRLQTNQLKPSAADDDMEKIFEERRAAAELEIARLDEEWNEYGYGKTSKSN